MEPTNLHTDLGQPISTLLEGRTGDIATVAPSATVAAAVRAMNDHRVGSVIVCQDDKVQGIFTERDALTRVIAEQRDPGQTRVEAVMTTDVIYVEPAATVEEAMLLMTERRFRHLPVLDQEGRLRGIISMGDLAHWLVRHQQHRIDDLVQYISGGYRSSMPPRIARDFPAQVADSHRDR